MSYRSNEPMYTRFNLVYPIIPDVVAKRFNGTPSHSILLIHGTHWHSKRKRHLHDEEHRAILEAEGFHVFELAYGTRPNEQFWTAVSGIVKRIIYGENIKYAGRIKDLLALSMTESESIII